MIAPNLVELILSIKYLRQSDEVINSQMLCINKVVDSDTVKTTSLITGKINFLDIAFKQKQKKLLKNLIKKIFFDIYGKQSEDTVIVCSTKFLSMTAT